MEINKLKNMGVNTEYALSIWGDEDAYIDALTEYISSLQSKTSSLLQYKNNNDLENYAILVHSLKSEARYLGLDKEANIFLNHELNSKDNNIDYINDNFNELLNTIKGIKEMI